MLSEAHKAVLDKGVVTSVLLGDGEDAEDKLSDVPFWDQGNLDHYTMEALALRRSIRHDNRVKAQIERFWYIVEFSKAQGEMQATLDELGCQHANTVQRLKECVQKTCASERQFTENIAHLRKGAQKLSESLSEAEGRLVEILNFQQDLRKGEDTNFYRKPLGL